MTTSTTSTGYRLLALARRRADRSLLRTPAVLLAVPCVVLAHLFITMNPPVAEYAPARAAAVSLTMSVVAPTLSFCAAWEALTLRALWGLLTVNRPWWLVLIGRLAPVLAAGLLIQLVLYADALLTSSPVGWPGWQFPFLFLFAMLTWAFFGAAVALVFGRLLAITVALLVPYLLTSLPAGWEPLWLRHLNGNPFDCCATDQILDPRVTIGSVSALGAILLVSLCIARVRLAPSQDRPWIPLMTALGALIAGVAGASVVTDLGASPARPRAVSELVCRGQVCLYPEDSAAFDANAAAWVAVRASWSRLGLPEPTAYRVGPVEAEGILAITTTSSDVTAAKATMAQLLPRALTGCLNDFDDTDRNERLDMVSFLLLRDLGVEAYLGSSPSGGLPEPTPDRAEQLWRETARCDG